MLKDTKHLSVRTRRVAWVQTLMLVKNINIVADSINMASFQQKLLLKGSEESIEYFTRILKQVKDKAGYNTATAIIEALDHWGSYGTTAAKCEALER